MTGTCDKQGRRNFSPLPPHGTNSTLFVNSDCYPSDSDLADAVKLALQQTAQPPAAPLPVSFPKPHQGSGQRPGETWKEFFTRRDEHHAQIMEYESSAD